MNQIINCTINGESYELQIDMRETLLEMLRDRLNMTGTKKGCEAGECGACTVIVDGETIDSCLYLATWADGKKIQTIEGLEKDGQLSPIQQNYIDEGAVQCGFCSPGFILSTHVLLNENSNPSESEIRKGLAGNLCRCTGYQNIVRAVKKSAEVK